MTPAELVVESREIGGQEAQQARILGIRPKDVNQIIYRIPKAAGPFLKM